MTKDNSKEKVRQYLDGVVDRILSEKKKEITEKTKLLQEQKQAELKKVQTIKESLHSVLKDVNWDAMGIKEATSLIESLKKWTEKAGK